MKNCTLNTRNVCFSAAAFLTTFLLCITSTYQVIGSSIPKLTILQYIFLAEKNTLLENVLFSAPQLWMAITSNQWLVILFPLLASMPYMLSFSIEMETKFYRFVLARQSFGRYWRRVFLKNGITGAAAVSGGYLMYAIIVSVFIPNSGDYSADMRIEFSSALNRLLGTGSEWIYLANQVLVIFLFSFLTAQLCLLLYLVFENCYKSIGVSIISFYLLDQISISLFRENDFDGKYYIISPSSIVYYSQYTFESIGLNEWWYFIFVTVLIFLISLIGYAACKRRLAQ